MNEATVTASTNALAGRTSAGAAALLVAALLCAAPSRAQEREATCLVPETVLLGGSAGTVTFTRYTGHGSARVLDELDTWTKVKWVLRVFAPGLAHDEVAVHVYPRETARFLADYRDIERVELVRFFLACASEHGYTVASARVSRSDEDVGAGAVPPRGGPPSHVGVTIAPQGTKPQATLKGELSAFATARGLRRDKTQHRCQ